MADNTTLSAGSGGDTLRTEDRTTFKTPVSLIDVGGTASEAIIGDAGVGMPVKGMGTAGTADSAVVTVQGVASMTPIQIADNSGSITVDNGGTFAVQASQTGTWTVQPGNTANTTAWLVTGTGGTFPITDNGGSITVDWAGTAPPIGAGLEATALRVTIATDSTGVVSVDDNGGSLTVDGTVAVSGSVAVTDNSGSLTVDDGGLTISIDDGAGSITVDGTVSVSGTVTTSVSGTVAVTDNSGSLTVDNGGTFAVQATIAAGATTIGKAEDSASADADVGVPAMAIQKGTPADTAGTDGDYAMLQMSGGRLWCSSTVVGTVSHDGADSGAPIKIGAKASTSLSGLTLVANADRTDLFAGVDGVLITRPHCNLEDVVQERTTNTDGASTAFASGLAAPGAGIRLWIKKVTIANSSSSFCTVDLRDGSAGSVLWTCPVPATGGITEVFDPPLKLTANTALAFDASAATSTLSISANGFKSKV